MRAGLGVWLLLATVVTLMFGQPVLGHASPVNGAALSQSPPVIRAWSSEELAVQGSVMRPYDSQQKRQTTGRVDTTVSDHAVLKTTPPTLRTGSDAVAWRDVSAHDKAARHASFRFSVSSSGHMPSQTLGSMTGSMSSQTPVVPPLAIVSPAAHATVSNPLMVVIDTTGDITMLTMGSDMTMSGMGPNVHLHIVVDSLVMMPAAVQLVKLGSNRYGYKLGRLAAGAHTITVFWADNKTHQPVGPVHSVTCMVAG